MEINSKLLGKQTIDPETIITFPHGIPGFENERHFKLFHQDMGIIYWLQSVNNEDLTFSVTLPIHFGINYSFVLTDEEQALLQLKHTDDLMILILLHRQEEQDKGCTNPTIKGSIKSPLLINSATRLGMQKLLIKVEQSITLTETNSEIDLIES